MILIGEYIKYKLKSKGKHQIHSPFVFDFVTKCLKIKITKEKKRLIHQLKSNLKENHASIEISDFGAGSKKLHSKRKISAIYKNASSKGIYATLLYQLTHYYQAKNVLELGTSLGLGTIHLVLGNENCHVTTIDACENTQKVAKENLEQIKNITFIHSDFESYLKNLKNIQFDLVFIDGHHDGKALKYYLELLDNFSHNNTIFVLDDIRWSKNMFKAWNEIIKDEKYHLTLDLFRMGIIWKRPQQAKEHFMIKLKGILRGMI